MISDYLDKMLNKNTEDLKKLEKQMTDKLEDLKGAEGWLQSLQIEENEDINIFSPRMNDERREQRKIAVAGEVSRIKNDIEQLRKQIDVQTKKKQEYEQLIKESVKMANETACEEFLHTVYEKIEFCLAFVDSDKNRCKSELRKLKEQIRQYTNELTE